MFECICLALVFALMIYLIRRRVDVSYALVTGAVVVGLCFGIEWSRVPRGVGPALGGIVVNLGKAAIDPANLQLLGLVLLIQLLGHTLKHGGGLQQLIGTLKSLLRDRRAAMAAGPALIGLLPTPGGALFSAPMVGELANGLSVPGEDRTLINYWFRHVWEWTWPLYPGLLFASAILRAPLDRIILANAPLTLGAILIGAVFCFRRVHLPPDDHKSHGPATWRDLLAGVWPIVLLIVLTAAPALGRAAGMPVPLSTGAALLIALAVVNPLLLWSRRTPWREVWGLVRQTLSVRLIVLVYGVVAFRQMLDAYQAGGNLARAFAEWGVPEPLLLFALPLSVGLLTGYMPAAVAICFPLVASLIVDAAGVHYGRLALAYAGGLFGVLLSPVHLCLVLSTEYFKADFGRVYRGLFRMVAALAAVAVGTWLLWEAVGPR
ncbi:MAG TPA: DUF401 family protein [Planctomycetota bacterium]|nr:DUF401 family protein [Planctomycetota bacterium]